MPLHFFDRDRYREDFEEELEIYRPRKQRIKVQTAPQTLPRRMPPPPRVFKREARRTNERVNVIQPSELPPGAAPETFVHKRILAGVGGFITGGGLGGAISGFVSGGGGGGGSPGGYRRAPRLPTAPILIQRPVFTGANRGQGLGSPLTGCDPGMTMRNGVCVRAGGFIPAAQRFLGIGGGGTNGGPGEAVAGGFNMPAFTPDVVGNISRMDGSSGPILRCPSGTVLATDNLCYAKGTKGLAAHRKWKPTPPGFLPRKDIVCLRRAVSIRKNKSNRAMFRELGLG